MNPDPAGKTEPRYEPPYVGLLPFGEDDAIYFCGRDFDTQKAATCLRAAPLTVFYGPSGVGKSSLLNAGVVPHLRKISAISKIEGEPPEFIIVVLREWANDPLKSLNLKIKEAVVKTLDTEKIPKRTDRKNGEPENIPDGKNAITEYLTAEDVKAKFQEIEDSDGLTMKDVLTEWTNFFQTRLLIILDQFEELFLHDAFLSGPRSFGEEFPETVGSRDLTVNFMLSIRDDALSSLDHFTRKIPDLLRNPLRLDHLNKDTTEEAIREPILRFNELHERELDGFIFDIEDELVDKLMEELIEGKINYDIQGHARVEDFKRQESSGTDPEYKVDLPHLQEVMVELWNDEETQKTRLLTLATLDRLKGVGEIVRKNLDRVIANFPVADRDLLSEFIHFTVTRAGTKIPSSAAGLMDWISPPDKAAGDETAKKENIGRILEELSTGRNRVFRPVTNIKRAGGPFYEIAHDALAPAILSWRSRYIEERRFLLRYTKVKKWGLIAGVVGIAIIAVIFMTSRYILNKNKQYSAEVVDSVILNSNDNKLQTDLTTSIDQTDDLLKISEKLIQKNANVKDAALADLRTSVGKKPLSAQIQTSFLALITGRVDQPTLDEVKNILGQNEIVYPPKAFIYFADQSQTAVQGEVAGLIRGAKILVPGASVQNVALFGTQVRYFRADDRKLAERVAGLLRGAGLLNVVAAPQPNNEQIDPQQLEIWFAPDAFTVAAVVKTDGGKCRMRSSRDASDDDNIIHELSNGETVQKQICVGRQLTITDPDGTVHTGRWCKVLYKGDSGWIFEPLLVPQFGSEVN